MPSPTHQTLVLLFHRHPAIALELSVRAGAPVWDVYERLAPAPTEFDDPNQIGKAVRADLALVGHKNGKPRRALVFEVQLARDDSKEWTTVSYRSGLRRQEKCPAWTTVFSPDEDVRDHVRTQMFVEEPELRPRIVTPEMVPPIRDLDTALIDTNWAWAVLAVVMHGSDPDADIYARVAIQALLRVAPEDQDRYISLVTDSVEGEVMQRVREQLPPEDREPLSAWERRGSGFTSGLAEGLEKGREEGLEAMRAALRTVLEARALTIDARTHARIAACSEIGQLRMLFARAATIGDVSELFVDP